MPLNLINDKMILKNKVEMQPKIEYIIAPDSPNFPDTVLDKLKIDQHGEFGTVDAKAIKFNIEDVNDLDALLNKKRAYTVSRSRVSALSVDHNFTKTTPGLIVDNSENFKFGLEKVSQSYIVDDPGFYKKKAVKNLYSYYRRNMEHNVINPHWGFTNFNCISFFTIPTDNVPNTRQYSHMNGLFYPNRYIKDEEGIEKFAYDFLKDDEMTISFWINPRQQNIVISEDRVCQMNAGCIMHIPGFISIYMLPGDEVDFDNRLKSFNLCISLGAITLRNDIHASSVANSDPFSNPTTVFSGRLNNNDNGVKSGDYTYFSKKNVLKYNNWHNVVVKLRKENVDEDASTDTWRLQMFVDNEMCCNQTFENRYADLNNNQNDFNNNGIVNAKDYLNDLTLKQVFKSNNNFISIGNRFSNLIDNENTGGSNNKIKIEEAFKTLFSINKSNDGDLNGSYVNKQISFGKNFNNSELENRLAESYSTAANNNLYNLFLGSQIPELLDVHSWSQSPISFSTNPSNDAYRTVSFALNADLYDIRIYNDFIENIEEIIYKKNIIDFTDERLVFSVPVLYYDNFVNKKSIYNIHGSELQPDPIIDDHLRNITLVNAAQKSPVNVYFSDKSLGHEVNVDNFVVEFKQRVSPNIVFGNNFYSDENIYKYLSKLFEVNAEKNNLQKGTELMSILYKENSENYKIFNRDVLGVPNRLRVSFDEVEEKSSLFTSIANFMYKNNFIMPCDNGLQNIDYNIKGYYDDDVVRNIHLKQGESDFGFINLENMFDESIAYRQNDNLITSCGISSLINRSETSLSIVPENQRASFTIDDEKNSKTSYDKFRNISLRNYHRSNYDVNDQDAVMFKFLNDDGSNLSVGLDNFFKDKCNPLSRVINGSTDNCIDTFSAPISTKQISEDESIPYFRLEMPYTKIYKSFSENYSKLFCLSTQVIGKKIKKNTFKMYDPSLGGTYGQVEMLLKDNQKGGLYRADCKTPHATWNTVGHCLYSEGIATILHPSLENFGRDTLKISFNSSNSLNVFELNLPAHSGETNFSRNTSYNENLRHNESAFNSDESFVYITDIHLHDENLNIIAKAKLAKPFAKKNSDNVLFRLKLDY